MNLSARCALVLFLLAFVDLKIVSAAETGGTSTAKPGVCPRRRWGTGICAELCSNDSDCPNDEKCCHNGCGHNCIAPNTAKPEVCPRRPWGVGTCAELCSNDSDCPNDEKCCHNGCGHDCIAPYTGRIWSQSDRYTHLLHSLLLHYSGNKKAGDCNVHFIHIDQYISHTLSLELRHSIKKISESHVGI
uniref:WAP domain-containing protein n=1 Tax=Oncorhynchus mykiss TaxID=8022 RepID=A0A8C7M6H4_ONCMY